MSERSDTATGRGSMLRLFLAATRRIRRDVGRELRAEDFRSKLRGARAELSCAAEQVRRELAAFAERPD